MDLVVLALAKNYTNDSLAGSGALKGAPCTIKDIEAVTGGNNITFEWVDNNGVPQTEIMFVANGIDGARGDQGPQGLQGIQGIQGIQGPQGEKGDTGATGAQGIQGVPGDRGEKGDKGETGDDGVDGVSPTVVVNPDNNEDIYKLDITDTNGTFTTPNLVGRQGAQGIQGEKGDKGDIGEQGPQGIQGIQGEKGNDGYPFLIYKEYTDLSEFNASDFPEIGLMFMINNGVADANRPVYRYTGETDNPYSHVTDLTTSEGLKGDKGDKGDQGEQGIQGLPGTNGADGITYTPSIGLVQTVEAAQDANATIEVDSENKVAKFNFWIPRGSVGQQGLPGEKGVDGEKGEVGEKGVDGTTYTPEIGTIETVEAALAASASVELDNDTHRAKFNFSIPKGVGVANVEFTSSDMGDVAGLSGATDTYTITFTDGSITTYKVYNGSDCDIQIDDEGELSETSVWSNQKTSDEIAEVKNELPNIKKFISPNGTARYVTISAHALGDIEIHSAYAGKYMFTSSGSTPIFFGTSTYRGYTLTGWAWNSDNTTLYLRVNGHMDFVVSAFGSDRVTISDMTTTAPNGVTFDTTFEFNALTSQIVGTKTTYSGNRSIDINTAGRLTFIFSSMYSSQAGCYMLLSNYNTEPTLITLGLNNHGQFRVTATRKSNGVDTITVTTAGSEYSWCVLQF